MGKMKAIMNDPQAANHLSLAEVDLPVPGPSQAVVRVAAVSLNRGEIRMAYASQAQYVPGWDLAGIVEQPAADGSGPKAGARVVGFVPAGAWAEQAAVMSKDLTELPEGVSFIQAAALPVAGLTALAAVEKGGNLLGKRVLVTGASGGVGMFAVELARISGAAEVVGLTHQPQYAQAVREAGATQVVTGEDASGAEPFGPYHLVCDSVGGKVLASAVALLGMRGIAVTYGTTSAPEATINTGGMYRSCATLVGYWTLYELRTEPAANGLRRLVCLVADGLLHPRIEVQAQFDRLPEVARQLTDRQYAGKAVLTLA